MSDQGIRSAGRPQRDPVLVVKDVSVRFGAVRALEGVCFEVERGSLHAVIGPNGAGKSTLFNVLTGVYRATGGTVAYQGEIITDLRPHAIARRGVSRTFQNIELSHASVAENLMLGRHMRMQAGIIGTALGLGRVGREERKNRIRIGEIAELVGLSDQLDVRADELAYGDQKRVDLGRAIAAEPKLLLLDEPVAGMNRAERREIAQLIRQVHDELDLTVVLVEHDMPLVMGLVDACTVLDFGHVIASGTPQEIRTDPAVIEAYLGGTPITTPERDPA